MAIIEKTDRLLEKILYCDLRNNVGIDKAKKAIRLALREQDKDTRHACAESLAGGADSEVIRASVAHEKVINCNDGL